MKFSLKLSLAVIVLLSVSLSLVNYFTVSRNFNASLETSAATYMEQHLLERYALEADLMNQRKQGTLTDPVNYIRNYGDEMANYVQSANHWFVLYYGDPPNPIYKSLPSAMQEGIGIDVLQAEEQGYYVRQAGGRWVILVSSTVANAGDDLWLLSVYDVTGAFTERDRQISDALKMQLLVLAAATVVVVYMCTRLTRPIRRLNITSRKIASGGYGARSDIRSNDEIGELAANFNRMATAVEEQIDQLAASVQQREDFVSAFTHEVKTPMTAIIGYSDLLRSQDMDVKSRQRAAQFIHRESKRLESLSQKLLTLMGLSAEGAELLPVSLNNIFTDAARSVIPNLEEGYQLKIKPADDVVVLADRDLVVDLIRNLVLNALRAEPKDGFVRIGWTSRRGRVTVLVSDTGKGIKADELERIIEPFYMVDKSRARKQGSSGVGLALSQKIAQLHGGEIQIESEEGVGTTVSFTLQAQTEESRRSTHGEKDIAVGQPGAV